MYTPPAFREDRPEVLLRLMHQSRLPLLVSNGANGLPDVTHLPLLTDGTRIVGHLARANPHWKALREAGCAIAIFPGPEGYVSPSSYPSKAEHHRVVPTWNYEAVHAHGPIEIIEDAGRLHEIVSTLTDHHEKPRAARWKVDDAPADFIAGQLKGIVGVVLTIEALIGKRKLSQNRPAADRDGALEDVGQHNAALADAMRAAREGN
ncbi:FMN-binding negative transcriptional regulator [Sediminicoccus rosea]|uniref:FMN-binding negative transcriptional regulator n=1 Tax=Sediminicoccus rosea TaxID=1225128 RepID=A0ABZ0PJ89_9PROT|nr:FMN-binding negative transcriptional regulator [Sediminicoccus rosea]WPB85403.1 FMN-binding negative transcriptional regulator [Sediminicoccus rosea]